MTRPEVCTGAEGTAAPVSVHFLLQKVLSVFKVRIKGTSRYPSPSFNSYQHSASLVPSTPPSMLLLYFQADVRYHFT